ncbi:hypothetical protein DEDE109153_11415 [Deinococcus deserti]
MFAEQFMCCLGLSFVVLVMLLGELVAERTVPTLLLWFCCGP